MIHKDLGVSRILIMTSEFPPFRGGIATYSHGMASAAAHLGHEVTVFAPDYGRDNRSIDSKSMFSVHRFDGGPHSYRDLPSKILLLRRFHRPVDIVHAADWPFFLPLALDRRREGCVRVATLHGSEILYMRNAVRAMPLRLSGFWSGQIEIQANSNFTLDLFRREFPEATRVPQRVVTLGIGDEWFSSRTPRQLARQKLSVDEARFVVITVGRLVPRKGHLSMLHALGELPERIRSKITWFIVGPDEDKSFVLQLRAKIPDTGVDVRLFGALSGEDVRLAMDASDLFALTAVWNGIGPVEGFGLAYLEAAARGIPALGTRVGGIPDAVEDGVTGILVPSGDHLAISQQIERLYQDRGLLNRLADAAISRAKKMRWTDVASAAYRQHRPLAQTRAVR